MDAGPLSQAVDDVLTEATSRGGQESGPTMSREEIEATSRRLAERGYDPTVCPDAFPGLARHLAALRLGLTKQGMLLYGDCGTGKTLLFEIVFPRPRIVTADAIVTAWIEHGHGEAFDEIVFHRCRYDGVCVTPPRGLVVDELGAEPVGIRFGCREEVMVAVVNAAYRNWKRSGEAALACYFTANLDLDKLQYRYGQPVMDRLAEMCVWIEFRGKSQRQG